jgi:L-lactate dehydrogenase complex protein LldF
MTTSPTTFGPAVRTATHRALMARERLLADYPEWEDWRRQARAAKTAMVERWPEYLALLREQVESWGGEVFFANDAAQANDFILQVARRHRVAGVVQSKSMTAHEIGLPPFLAHHGIHLTETDLGEFIIQLAGHAPAHLTAPALHLNRFQIARILSDHLGVESPSDPAALTRLASDHLAGRYAQADMGITGVNFAAAQEGVLVCLENEGNLRLSATLPPVHLALMGWDKMISGLADLEPMLRLLPASATGQRLTSLVHFFKGKKSGPRGTQAFYLVILDNGRSRLAAHPELKEALYCLRCGACLNICPVFQVKGAHLYGRVYPGAIGALLAPFLPPVGDIADLCTQCGSCAAICPAAIELPGKIRYLRRKAPAFRRVRIATRAAGEVFRRPRLYRVLEYSAHAWLGGLWRARARQFLSHGLPRESFFRSHQRGKFSDSGPNAPYPDPKLPFLPSIKLKGKYHRLDGESAGAGAGLGEISPPVPKTLDRLKPDPPDRWAEAGTALISLQGAKALARHLGETAQGEIWLEDHPWLRPVARELAQLGIAAQVAHKDAALGVDTAVTVGLGGIPEIGAAVVPAGQGPAAWLGLQARRHVVLAPPERASLNVQEALNLVRKHQGSLVTWLTGPTRTADIEKILVLGAQGPAELTIILYQPKPSGE